MPETAEPTKKVILTRNAVAKQINSQQNIDASPQMNPAVTESPTMTDNSSSSNPNILSILLEIKKDMKINTAAVMKIDNYMEKNDENIVKINNNVQTNSSGIYELQQRFNEMEKRNFTLEERMENMQKHSNVNNVHSSNTEINQQYLLVNNLAISGVPFIETENLNELVEKLMRSININISEHSYLSIRRTKGNSRNHGLIIIRFKDYSTKRFIFENKKIKGNIFVEEIFPNLKSNIQIYFNHQLTPYFSKVFGDTRRALQQKLIHACWVTGKGVHIMRTSDGQKEIIEDASTITNILNMSLEKENVSNFSNEGAATNHSSLKRGHTTDIDDPDNNDVQHRSKQAR